MAPSQQNSLVLTVNVLVMVIVFALLHIGYKHGHQVSGWFWVLEFSTVALTGFAAGVQSVVSGLQGGGGRKRLPTPVQWWVNNREVQTPFFTPRGWLNVRGFASYRGVVYLSTAIGFAAMWILTDSTGGGVESPFAPLLVAPAILGPFIVRQKEVLALLLVIAVSVVVAEDLTAPRRAEVPSRQLDHPHPFVYATVTLILVVSAVVISYVRMETEGPAWGLFRQWRATLQSLRAKRRPASDLQDALSPGASGDNANAS